MAQKEFYVDLQAEEGNAKKKKTPLDNSRTYSREYIHNLRIGKDVLPFFKNTVHKGKGC